MLKGIKKKFSSNRSSARNRQRGSPGREQGEVPPREPPDKGGYKPTSPRQVHPVGHLSPVPYARRSLERRNRTGSPGCKPLGPRIYDKCPPDTFCGSPQTQKPSAYPTAPNICVTGGKIEFIQHSDCIMDVSEIAPPVPSHNRPIERPTPIPQTHTLSPQIKSRKIEEKLPSSIPLQQQSPSKTNQQQATLPNASLPTATSEPSTPSPASSAKRSSGRKSRLGRRNLSSNVRKSSLKSSVVGGSLNLKNKQESLLVRRSATMPECDDTVKELEKLRKENKYVKHQLETLKKKYSKLEEQNEVLEKEKEELLQDKEDKEECMEKLTQYQSLIERCSALEYANAQLQAESQVQRHQYEKCLDQVASQVVQAILVQKNQQEQCERLSKQVESLKKQNEDLNYHIHVKGSCAGTSLSLRHPRKRDLLFQACSTFNSQSLSLPNTLKRQENICDNSKNTNNISVETLATTEVSSFDPHKLQRTCSNEIATPARSSSLSSSVQSTIYPDYKDNNKEPSLDTSSNRVQAKGSPACWYDIIKSLQKGQGPPPELLEHSSIVSSDSSADTEDQSLDILHPQRSILNDESCTNSSEEECNTCLVSVLQNESCRPALSSPSGCLDCLSSHCSIHSRQIICNNEPVASVMSPSSHRQQEVVANWAQTNIVVEKLPDKLILCDNNDQKTSDISNNGTQKQPLDKKENTKPEVSIKDEGYSTMSSDVQTEAKDSVVVCKISTVEEEKVKSIEAEDDSQDICNSKDTLVGLTQELPMELPSTIETNASNISAHTQPIQPCPNSPPQYSDGMRIVYDEDVNNSDVFLIPFKTEKLFRHSFNIPYSCKTIKLRRSLSDSYLHKNNHPHPLNRGNLEQTTLPSLSSLKKCPDSFFNFNLFTNLRRESIKSRKLYNKPLTELIKASSTSSELHKKCGFPNSCSPHSRILSPSYSHAEMEDWSLDLSAEDIGTLGETDPSLGDSTAPLLLSSQPSIQEATLDLEEDTSEFLWNGATYFKAQDHELDWHYEKEQNKVWDLNLLTKGQQQSLISPKSGCSDQPAIWSSSDQLSCCSDIASKCSTDIENFCEQLCNLPELKRVSFCSSENGRPESINSLSKLSEIESIEDNSELTDDLAGIDTVFTRDFYRLVKFESTKSLAASSKSLAMSEGFLTMDRLQGLDACQSSKTLASVLGFIAEQQQYCKEREVLDETPLSLLCSKINTNIENLQFSKNFENGLQQIRASNASSLNNNEFDSKRNHNQQKMLSSSESLSCLNLDSERTTSEDLSEDENRTPPRPKRSTSLNLGAGRNQYRQKRRNLPPIPLENSPPSPPSRSTSKPNGLCTVPSRSSWFSHKMPEPTFPPPPTYEEIYNETYDSLAPAIPPHGLTVPSLPKRSSSILDSKVCESPPIPKRITSRALPKPPPHGSASLKADLSSNAQMIPNRTSSLGNGKLSDHRCRRPKSLLKEATVANAASKKKNRGSCGELGSACRNSATLLYELQKMAKAEEDEKGSSDLARSPEATSPNHEVGLGTGWVKVEPMTDLADPQARANLLDSMMNSSEGCSSETDEDLAKHLQHNHLLKAVQRNRRRKKALLPNYSKNLCWTSHNLRPTFLGDPSMFTRYGCEEREALQEFEFLDSFPSNSEDNHPNQFGQKTSSLNVCRSPQIQSNMDCFHNRSQNYQMNLTDLPSSEPCHSQEYPLMSDALFDNSLPHGFSSISNFIDDHRQSNNHFKDCCSSSCPQSPTRLSCYDGEVPMTSTHFLLPQPHEHAFEQPSSYDMSLRRENLTLDLQGMDGHFSHGQSFISPIEDSHSDSNLSGDLKHGCTTSSKQMQSSIPIRYKAESNIFARSKEPSEMDHDYGVDTRSLCNVKAAIQKFNASSKSNLPISNMQNTLHQSCNDSNVSSQNSTVSPNKLNVKLKNSKLPNRITPSNSSQSSSKNNKFSPKSSENSSNISKSKISSVKKNDKSKSVSKVLSPSNKKYSPKKTSTTIKSLTGAENGSQKQNSSKAVQPNMKSKKAVHLRPKKTSREQCKKKTRGSTSSDGSDHGGVSGRISISDSCAELFSPVDSGDEVFHK